VKPSLAGMLADGLYSNMLAQTCVVKISIATTLHVSSVLARLFQLAMTAALANLTLVAGAGQPGILLYFLIALTLVLILESRMRMRYRTLSLDESSRTRLRLLEDFKTGGSQLAF
jgi:hypothetical protein